MSTAIAKKKDFTQGPILSQIIVFTLPLIATAVLQLLFNTADVLVVGRWGGNTPDECETALAAVGSCGALTNLLVNLLMGLSSGAGVCFAHAVGAKRYEDAREIASTSILAGIFCGFFAMVLGLFAARPMLAWMGTEEVVMAQAVPYMQAYFLGIPASMVYNYAAALLRSDGDSTSPLVFLSIAGVSNVLLNLLTVLVFRMGALGVGIATAVSNWISCILVLRHMAKSNGNCHLDLKHLRLHRGHLGKILGIGLPTGIQSSLFSLSNVLIQSSINSLGKVVVAGNTAGSNIDGYLYAIQNAIALSAMTAVGQNMGAKQYKRLKKCLACCVLLSLVIGIILAGAVLLFGRTLLGLYAPENEAVVEKGMIRLLYVGVPYFLCGMMEIGASAMRALGKSITPMIISLLGSCAFRVVWIFTVFAATNSLELLYLSYPISWFLTAGTQFIFCLSLMHGLVKKNAALQQPVPAPTASV